MGETQFLLFIGAFEKCLEMGETQRKVQLMQPIIMHWRTHLQTHSGEKFEKCNNFDFILYIYQIVCSSLAPKHVTSSIFDNFLF